MEHIGSSAINKLKSDTILYAYVFIIFRWQLRAIEDSFAEMLAAAKQAAKPAKAQAKAPKKTAAKPKRATKPKAKTKAKATNKKAKPASK